MLVAKRRYSFSLMPKLTRMGSTVETVVITVAVPTRSPTWDLAIPAIPSMGEVTFVQPRLRAAWSTAARAEARAALAARSAESALSSSCWLIARSAARGVNRSTSLLAFASWASAWPTAPWACSSAARNWRGSISKSGAPAWTNWPSL